MGKKGRVRREGEEGKGKKGREGKGREGEGRERREVGREGKRKIG